MPGVQYCDLCKERFSEDKRQCPHCGTWQGTKGIKKVRCKTLRDCSRDKHPRLASGAWDYIFGGGLQNLEGSDADGWIGGGMVPTSVNLLGGTAGAGKSTLCLQIADGLLKNAMFTDRAHRPVLLLATEEAGSEVYLRAERLNIQHLDRILIPEEMVLDLDTIDSLLLEYKPQAVFVDSIAGYAGDQPQKSVALCKYLKVQAVKFGAPVVCIDHITKDGQFAGLQALQHEVDGTFWIRKERGVSTFQPIKNRFGSTSVKMHFQMTEHGLDPITEAEMDDEDDENEDEPDFAA